MSSMRLAVVSVILMSAIGCAGYDSSPAPAPSPTPTPGGPSSSVTIPVGAEGLGNRAFTPDQLDITAGTTVTWTNTDVVSHTSTSDGTGWNSGTLPAGGRFSFTFPAAGTFPYHCTIHPGMVGTVVVR